jgi:hypothetical protein
MSKLDTIYNANPMASLPLDSLLYVLTVRYGKVSIGTVDSIASHSCRPRRPLPKDPRGDAIVEGDL